MSGAIIRLSAPASTARTATSPSPYFSRTPCMASESVVMTPLKPSSWRRMPVRIGLLSVAGSPEGSSAGTTRCPLMIMSAPALIAALNGGASVRSHCSLVCVITGMPVWLSVAVSPWPGKCLGVATIPASFW